MTSCHSGLLLAEPFLGTFAYLFFSLFFVPGRKSTRIFQDPLKVIIIIKEGGGGLSPAPWFTVMVKSFAIYCSLICAANSVNKDSSATGGENKNLGKKMANYCDQQVRSSRMRRRLLTSHPLLQSISQILWANCL